MTLHDKTKTYLLAPVPKDELALLFSDAFAGNQLDVARGCIGHLRADFGYQGKEFWPKWFDHCSALKTPIFRDELNTVINCLREKGNLLDSLSALTEYCRKRPDAWFDQQYRDDNYGFRIDTELHRYYLRAMLTQGDYNLYCYCYARGRLKAHLAGTRSNQQIDEK